MVPPLVQRIGVVGPARRKLLFHVDSRKRLTHRERTTPRKFKGSYVDSYAIPKKTLHW